MKKMDSRLVQAAICLMEYRLLVNILSLQFLNHVDHFFRVWSLGVIRIEFGIPDHAIGVYHETRRHGQSPFIIAMVLFQVDMKFIAVEFLQVLLLGELRAKRLGDRIALIP